MMAVKPSPHDSVECLDNLKAQEVMQEPRCFLPLRQTPKHAESEERRLGGGGGGGFMNPKHYFSLVKPYSASWFFDLRY